jgi:hypothetical protein
MKRGKLITEEDEKKIKEIIHVIDEAIVKINPHIDDTMTALILFVIHLSKSFNVSKPILLNYISEEYESDIDNEDTDFSDDECKEW